jgi:Domain of unknown function (DUF4340)
MSERGIDVSGGRGFWRSDRGVFLLALLVIALVTSLAAAFIILREEQRTAPRFSPAQLFEGLEDKLGAAADITVVSPEGRIEVRRVEGDGWVVPSASNYPAHMETVRKMLLGLASLKAIERRTARHDWLATLDLIAPGEGGKATELRVNDAKGALIAGLLVGKLSPAGALEGEDAFYVRRVGEDQVYLAQGNLPLDVARASWLDPTIVDLARERVFRVTLTPTAGPAFSLSRADPQAQDFALDAIPKGRHMVSETAGNAIGAALSEFTLEDVRPRADVDFKKQARAVFETFDGLVVAVDTVEAKDGHWVRVTAEAKKPRAEVTNAKAPDIAAEAKAINARVGAWVYRVPDWKAALFARDLDSLLAEPETETNPKESP